MADLKCLAALTAAGALINIVLVFGSVLSPSSTWIITLTNALNWVSLTIKHLDGAQKRQQILMENRVLTRHLAQRDVESGLTPST